MTAASNSESRKRLAESAAVDSALTDLLAAHGYRESTAGRAAHCSCGTWLLGAAALTHRDHLAIAIRDHYAARIVQARAGEGALRERIEALLPDCYVTREEVMPCSRFIGGTFDNGAVWTEDMCCLPCRLRAALDPEATT